MEKVYIDYFEEEPCKDCNAIENCKSLGIECTVREHYIDAIPKQEAIEVMAKAMFVILPRFSNLECEVLAEAALNALLEGGK